MESFKSTKLRREKADALAWPSQRVYASLGCNLEKRQGPFCENALVSVRERLRGLEGQLKQLDQPNTSLWSHRNGAPG